MKKWIITRTRYAPCYWPFQTYFGWDVKDYWGMKNTPCCIHVWEKGNFTAYLEETATLELGHLILNRLMESKDLSLIRANGLESGNQVVTELRNLAEKYVANGPSISKTIAYLEKVAELYPIIQRDNMHFWLHLGFVLEPEIRTKLSDISPDSINRILKDMSVNEEKSYSAKEEDSFFEIVDKAKDEGIESASVKKAIQKFTNQYFWFPYEYAGPNSWDTTAVTARVKNSFSITHHKPPASSEIISIREKCIREFNLSQKVVKLFEIMRTMSLMQDDRKMMNSQICYYTNGVVLKMLANELGISERLILYTDIPLLRFAESNKDKFIAELTKRAEAYAIVQITKNPVVITGKEIERQLGELGIIIEIENTDVKELSGSSGYKGIITGRVRVLATSHVTDFQEGDIIVTGMTTPDFVPLIRKASAIIANEGGITCHAAIVARELKKPCIVGTKIATKILRDGDLVEVDANNGIVRIIEKGKVLN